jgi:pantothenate kinase
MLTNKEVDVNAWVDETTLFEEVAKTGDFELISLLLGLVDDVNFREIERAYTPLRNYLKIHRGQISKPFTLEEIRRILEGFRSDRYYSNR